MGSSVLVMRWSILYNIQMQVGCQVVGRWGSALGCCFYLKEGLPWWLSLRWVRLSVEKLRAEWGQVWEVSYKTRWKSYPWEQRCQFIKINADGPLEVCGHEFEERLVRVIVCSSSHFCCSGMGVRCRESAFTSFQAIRWGRVGQGGSKVMDCGI